VIIVVVVLLVVLLLALSTREQRRTTEPGVVTHEQHDARRAARPLGEVLARGVREACRLVVVLVEHLVREMCPGAREVCAA
jgi:hypothetical protein